MGRPCRTALEARRPAIELLKAWRESWVIGACPWCWYGRLTNIWYLDSLVQCNKYMYVDLREIIISNAMRITSREKDIPQEAH